MTGATWSSSGRDFRRTRSPSSGWMPMAETCGGSHPGGSKRTLPTSRSRRAGRPRTWPCSRRMGTAGHPREGLQRRDRSDDLPYAGQVPQADPLPHAPQGRPGRELQPVLVSERPPDRLHALQRPPMLPRRHLDDAARRQPPEGGIEVAAVRVQAGLGPGTDALRVGQRTNCRPSPSESGQGAGVEHRFCFARKAEVNPGRPLPLPPDREVG